MKTRVPLRDYLRSSSRNLEAFNFFHMLLESTIFWTSMSILDVNTVISVFLDTAAGSPIYSGLAATLKAACYTIGNFVVVSFIHRLRSQKKFMTVMGFVGRPMILVSALLMLAGLDGKAAAIGFLICYALFYFTDGFIGLAWQEIMVRTIPVQSRGKVTSYNYLFGGIMGVLAGQFVSYVMRVYTDTRMRFMLLFGVAGLILVLNAVSLALIRDIPGDLPVEKKQPFSAYVRSFGTLLRASKPFRLACACKFLYLCGMLAAPINILFGRSMGGLTDADVATLLTVQVIGQMIGGYFWGKLSAVKGYRIVMVLTQAINLGVGAVSLIAYGLGTRGIPLMLPMIFIMFFSKFAFCGQAGYANYMLAATDKNKCSNYLALMGLLMLPADCGMLCMGAVCASIGYLAVFIFTTVCAAAGFVLCMKFFGGKRGIAGENM